MHWKLFQNSVRILRVSSDNDLYRSKTSAKVFFFSYYFLGQIYYILLPKLRLQEISKGNFISPKVNIDNIGKIFSGTIPIGRTGYTYDKAASVSRLGGNLSCDHFQLKCEGKKCLKYF